MRYNHPRAYDPEIETVVQFADSISEREFEIFQAVENALANKIGLRVVAKQLDLSLRTVYRVSSSVRRIIHNIDLHVQQVQK